MLNILRLPPGSLVMCEIMHLFEHTGIYIGNGWIVELQGTGLVRAITPTQFLAGRTGEQIAVATGLHHRIFASEHIAERAAQHIYSYQTYDLLRNNCHRFSVSCITGRFNQVTSFFDLKQELQQHWQSPIVWRPVRHW